jgi:hypothetical protein
MSLDTVEKIEQAIAALEPAQIAEVYSWLDQHYVQTTDTATDGIDARLASDLAMGHLDEAIQRALEDENSGRLQPL